MSGYTAFAKFYDMLTANIDYRARGEYFHSLIHRHGGEKGILLDLACGTGSLSMEMARLGYDVIGVDASQEMLSVAMQKAADTECDILYLCQDMDNLDLYGTVDVCICALDSINHLPDEDALDRALEKVALFLAPGGLFLFDVNTPYKHREILGNNTFIYDLDQVFCVWQNTLRNGNVVEIALDIFEETPLGTYRRYSESFQERIFRHEFLENRLQKHGFHVLELLEGDGLSPPSETAQRLVYVVKKQLM